MTHTKEQVTAPFFMPISCACQRLVYRCSTFEGIVDPGLQFNKLARSGKRFHVFAAESALHQFSIGINRDLYNGIGYFGFLKETPVRRRDEFVGKLDQTDRN
jgi:hypothetical protein